MKRILLLPVFILCFTVSAFAQHKATKAKKPMVTHKAVDINGSRGIVDNNYSYYNPEKGGYVFYDNGRESFLPALPVIPENNQQVRQSVPLGKRLNLDLYPQLHYPNTQLVHPDKNTN